MRSLCAPVCTCKQHHPLTVTVLIINSVTETPGNCHMGVTWCLSGIGAMCQDMYLFRPNRYDRAEKTPLQRKCHSYIANHMRCLILIYNLQCRHSKAIESACNLHYSTKRRDGACPERRTSVYALEQERCSILLNRSLVQAKLLKCWGPKQVGQRR